MGFQVRIDHGKDETHFEVYSDKKRNVILSRHFGAVMRPLVRYDVI